MSFRILLLALIVAMSGSTLVWAEQESKSSSAAKREHDPRSVVELVPSDRIRVRKTGPTGRNAEGHILAIDRDMILLYALYPTLSRWT